MNSSLWLEPGAWTPVEDALHSLSVVQDRQLKVSVVPHLSPWPEGRLALPVHASAVVVVQGIGGNGQVVARSMTSETSS